MVQIDTLSLLKAANKAGSGTNTAPKSSATLGAFDQILSGQANTSQVTELGGNSQPSGNNLPTDALPALQQAQSSQQSLATLSLQQHSQIDDLSFITQLQPLVDMSQTPVAVASAHYTDKKMNFSDQQLQGLAVQLGIEPAVAKLVVQGTEFGSLTDADVLMVRGQQIATQSFLQQREARAVSQMADNKMELANTINTINIMLSKAKTLAVSTTELTAPSAAISNAAASLQQREARAVSQMADNKMELANTINTMLPKAKTLAVSTTELMVPSTATSNAAASFAGITLAPLLVQKLDQFSGGTSVANSTTHFLEAQALGSYTGANFKASAPLPNLLSGVGVAMNSDASAMDLSQRFTSLMQGDGAAQAAARQVQDQLGQQLQRMVKEGSWQANLSLNPARLGQVNIHLIMEDGVLQTQLLSGNAGVRELLESSLPRLREQLETSGLQLAGVFVGNDSQGQQQTRGDEPDWQLTQTVISTTAEEIPNTGLSNNSGHDGDVDTFA